MEIEFTTDNKVALEHFPPLPASEIVPDWYRDLNIFLHGKKQLDAKYMMQIKSGTMYTAKACLPLGDYMKCGYVLRSHSEILFTPSVEPDGTHSWFANSLGAEISSHGYAQLPLNIGKGKNVYIKYTNPWRIKTPPGYSCLIYQHHYFFNNKISFFPAIVDTDSYNDSPISFPGVILAENTFFLEAGEPLVVVFPFKRENWIKKVKFEEQKNIKDLSFSMYFVRGYKRLFHKQKSYE